MCLALVVYHYLQKEMGNRLAFRNKAVPLCDIAKKTRVAVRSTVRKWPWNCNGTGHRLPGIESRIRIAVAGSGIQEDAFRKTKTTRNENILKEFRNGIGQPVENIALFQHGRFHGLPNNKKNSVWEARPVPICFGEDYKFGRRTFDRLVLNAFVLALSTIGFLFGFATYFGVSGATDPKPEDEDSYYSQESPERFDKEEFSDNNGTTKRDKNFSFVFRPKRRKNRADVLLALETAKQEVEMKAYFLEKNGKRPPSVVAFLVDKDGNTFATHSIRGKEAKEKLYGKDNEGGKIYEDLRDLLKEIAETGKRGVGHGSRADVPGKMYCFCFSKKF